MKGPDGPRRTPVDVQQDAAGSSKKSRRVVRGAPQSDVHSFVPTANPNKRIRVEKGSKPDLPQDYIDTIIEAADRFGPIELQVKDLEEDQKDDDKFLKAVGILSVVRGVVSQPEEGIRGYDLQIIPSVSIDQIDEEAFRKGNSTLFQATTHPETVFLLRIPDGYLGRNGGPITADMVRPAMLGLAIGLGIRAEDLFGLAPKKRVLTQERRLNADEDRIKKEIIANGSVPGVKTKTGISIKVFAVAPTEPVS